MNDRKFPSGVMPVSAIALTLAAMFALSGCGGGMGSQASTGTTQPVTLSGTLSGTPGALTFNQQPLNAASAAVTVNGLPASPATLQPGMVLRGHGHHGDHGLDLEDADVVKDAEGPISAVDTTASTLTVLGIVVSVDGQTSLVDHGAGPSAALTLADFAVGDNVEVFGLRQTAGTFLATRIERQAAHPTGAVELRGAVTGLDPVAKTFSLGPIVVNYSTAQVHGTLAEAAQVEVAGTLSGTTITAGRVRVEEPMDEAGGEAELSGLLSNLDANSKTFSLQTFKVDYSAAKVEGVLAEGADVEVHGAVSANDPTVLLADKVTVEDHAEGMGGGGQGSK